MLRRFELPLLLFVAVVLGVVVWAANRAPTPPPEDSRTSTLLAGPDGSKALHEVLVRLGRPVERRRTPLFTLTADTARRPGLLVLLNPPAPLQPAELQQVARYVREGGAVLAAGRGGGVTACVGWRVDRKRIVRDSLPVRPPNPGVRLPPAARVLAPRDTAGESEANAKRRAEGDDPCAPLVALGTDTLIAATDGRPVILRLRYANGGTITLAADPGWFTNRAWRDTDVSVVLLPLLSPAAARGGGDAGGGRVTWDEYHQGFGRDGPSMESVTWDWLRHTPVGWAVLQLVAVALVWLAMTAVRFGPARSVIERRRRSPLEHLEALAAGLESAADAEPVVQRLVAGLKRRLGHPKQYGLDSLELAMRGARGRAAVRRLRHLILERGGAPSQRVLGAAQAVEDVWEELRPRTTRDAL